MHKSMDGFNGIVNTYFSMVLNIYVFILDIWIGCYLLQFEELKFGRITVSSLVKINVVLHLFSGFSYT